MPNYPLSCRSERCEEGEPRAGSKRGTRPGVSRPGVVPRCSSQHVRCPVPVVWRAGCAVMSGALLGVTPGNGAAAAACDVLPCGGRRPPSASPVTTGGRPFAPPCRRRASLGDRSRCWRRARLTVALLRSRGQSPVLRCPHCCCKSGHAMHPEGMCQCHREHSPSSRRGGRRAHHCDPSRRSGACPREQALRRGNCENTCW